MLLAKNKITYHQEIHGTYTKIVVPNLSKKSRNDDLRLFYEKFGEVLEAFVVNDEGTGRSKCYGFLTFKDQDSARRSVLKCQESYYRMGRRKVRRNPAAFRADQRFSQHGTKKLKPSPSNITHYESPFFVSYSYYDNLRNFPVDAYTGQPLSSFYGNFASGSPGQTANRHVQISRSTHQSLPLSTSVSPSSKRMSEYFVKYSLMRNVASAGQLQVETGDENSGMKGTVKWIIRLLDD